MTRPLVLVAVLVPIHLVAQRLLVGRVVPAALILPVLAVVAYEALTRVAERRRAAGS